MDPSSKIFVLDDEMLKSMEDLLRIMFVRSLFSKKDNLNFKNLVCCDFT